MAYQRPEDLPSSVFILAWGELYKAFSEQGNLEAIMLMDGVLAGVEDECRVDMALARFGEEHRQEKGGE